MSGSRVRRGQPLLVLGLLIAGWVGARAVLWEGVALPSDLPASLPILSQVAQSGPTPAVAVPVNRADVHERPARTQTGPLELPQPLAWPTAPVPPAPAHAPLPAFAPGGEPAPGAGVTRLSGGHQIAWIAGLAQLPAPLFLQARTGPAAASVALHPPVPAARPANRPASRWSVDGWFLLREGGVGTVVGGLPPASYGASQAGAVVRYRLAPSSQHRPAAYLRAAAGIHAPRGEEAAVGLAARPLPQLPLVLTGELRASRLASGTALRPAITLVTELEPLRLPLGARAELYAHGGYVGGRGATPFIDAQARIDRQVAKVGPVELRAGAGAWGGAQRGASRIDVGPTATVDFPLARGRGRIAADWRMRVGGNAAPQSGPALTLSAGF